jgi:hypothetical protein
VNAIINKPAPYGEIFKLPALLDEYEKSYGNLLKSMETPVLDAIEQSKQRVFEVLGSKECRDQLDASFQNRWRELSDKAASCDNAATLLNIKAAADALKIRMLDEIDAAERKILAGKAKESEHSDDSEKPDDHAGQPKSDPITPKAKRSRHISIKNVMPESSWRLESASDVDKYLAALREKLLDELEEDTIVNIEF